MTWTIISAILPWSTLALVGLLMWYSRKAQQLTESLADKTFQIQQMNNQIVQYKVLQAQSQRQIKELQDAYFRASQAQMRATRVALDAANGAPTEQNAKAIKDLLNG